MIKNDRVNHRMMMKSPEFKNLLFRLSWGKCIRIEKRGDPGQQFRDGDHLSIYEFDLRKKKGHLTGRVLLKRIDFVFIVKGEIGVRPDAFVMRLEERKEQDEEA